MPDETVSAPRYAGAIVDLGGTEFTVPPVALKTLKLYATKLKEMKTDASGVPTDMADLDLILDLALAALNRNYPALKKSELEEIVDLGNFAPLSLAVFGQAGLVRAAGDHEGKALSL